MKITLLNVKYSQNLGDGIIAECLEHALQTVPIVSLVKSCDLAGRVEFGGKSNYLRQTVRMLLDRLPTRLRRWLSIRILKRLIRSKLRSHYTEALVGSDIAIIGGGQLIADAELNFPLKIQAAARAARQTGNALGIYAIGVGASFSQQGSRLFDRAFDKGLASVKVRDARSAKRWHERFGDEAIGHVWDPGLLSEKVYGRPNGTIRRRKRIGIGIIHPGTLDLHADHKTDRMSRTDWIKFYSGLCEFFIAQDWTVELFTNGAFSDHAFAKKVQAHLNHRNLNGSALTLAETPKTPQELAHLIAGYSAIVAHRLHANIVAYSYAIPHVGLGWDSKMEGFFEATGRETCLISAPSLSTIDHIGNTVMQAVQTPIPRQAVTRVQAEVEQQIGHYCDELSRYLEDQVTFSPRPYRPARFKLGLNESAA